MVARATCSRELAGRAVGILSNAGAKLLDRVCGEARILGLEDP